MNNKIILNGKPTFKEYIGNFNFIIDERIRDANPGYPDFFKSYELKPHYYEEGIYAGQYFIPIRVPGESIGAIFIDKDNFITNIKFNESIYSFHKTVLLEHNEIKYMIGKEVVYNDQ